jgi:hypothetical protein
VRRALLAAIACAALVALIAPPAAPAAPGSDVTAAAKKKRCKKGQVRVRSGKRVSCVRARQVLPKPKRGDPRLLLARSAFGRDWSRVRNRRGKRAQSLPKLVRKLGPRAPRLLSRVTARGLGVIDNHAATAARAHSAATGCRDVPPGARQQDSFTSSAGGVRATVTSTVGSDGAQLGMELTGNEFTLSAELDFGACEPNEVEAPQCPTAAGQLSGEIRYKMRVSIKVSRGGENVWSQSAEITRRTKLEGFTDVDAKLDFLDVEDNEVSTVRLGGSTRAFPPISIRTRLTRNTRVNMRTGAYEPGLSDITVTVDMEGLFGADRSDLQDQLEQRGRGDADQQFRSVIEKAVSGYRNREERWQQPGVCAKLELMPTPGSLTLKPDQAGIFTATAKAVQDGNTSELDARLSEQVGAAFEPTRAGGQQARFGYTVHHGTRDRVAVKVRATSKAGVAEGTWEQPVEPPPPPPPSAYNGTFSGTGVYDENELGSGNHMNASWSGSFHATWSGPSSPGASDASLHVPVGHRPVQLQRPRRRLRRRGQRHHQPRRTARLPEPQPDSSLLRQSAAQVPAPGPRPADRAGSGDAIGLRKPGRERRRVRLVARRGRALVCLLAVPGRPSGRRLEHPREWLGQHRARLTRADVAVAAHRRAVALPVPRIEACPRATRSTAPHSGSVPRWSARRSPP